MKIYFIMLILIFICSFIKNKCIQKRVIFSIFFLVSSLRYIYLGTDTFSYISYFRRFSRSTFKELFLKQQSIERGFAIFNKVLGLISKNERYFLVMIAIIVMILITKFIYDNSKIPWFSFFLFLSLGFFTASLNILRQVLAVLIMINTLDYIRKRNIKKFLFYYFIAISIHITAAIFILAYILYPIKVNLNYIYFTLLITGLIHLYADKILILLFTFSNKYSLRYTSHLNSGQGKGMLIMIVGVLSLGYVLEKLEIKRDRNVMFYHMLTLAVFLQIIALKFSLFVRVVNYFSIGLIIFIPNIVNKIERKDLKFLVVIGICLITSFYLYMILDKNLSKVVPYRFLFQ